MACSSSGSSVWIAVIQLGVWCITGVALLYRGIVVSTTPPGSLQYHRQALENNRTVSLGDQGGIVTDNPPVFSSGSAVLHHGLVIANNPPVSNNTMSSPGGVVMHQGDIIRTTPPTHSNNSTSSPEVHQGIVFGTGPLTSSQYHNQIPSNNSNASARISPNIAVPYQEYTLPATPQHAIQVSSNTTLVADPSSDIHSFVIGPTPLSFQQEQILSKNSIDTEQFTSEKWHKKRKDDNSNENLSSDSFFKDSGTESEIEAKTEVMGGFTGFSSITTEVSQLHNSNNTASSGISHTYSRISENVSKTLNHEEHPHYLGENESVNLKDNSATITLTPVSDQKLTRVGGDKKHDKTVFNIRPGGLLMMVTGSAMIVIGPVLLILKICESRCQHGNFYKLQPDDTTGVEGGDLPPSYEQVMREPQRYTVVSEEEPPHRYSRETPC